MRKQVRIERRTQGRDANGERKFNWDLVAARRAEQLQTPGRELWTSDQRVGRIPTIFKLRHPRADFDVLPQDRLLCDGNVFNIISAIDPNGLRVVLLVTCELLVNETPTGQ